MSSFSSDNIPQEINKVLSATSTYEELETKITNHLLKSTNILAILKSKCQKELINNEDKTFEDIVNSLSLESPDDILGLDPTQDKNQLREQLKELITRDLQNIVY